MRELLLTPMPLHNLEVRAGRGFLAECWNASLGSLAAALVVQHCLVAMAGTRALRRPTL